MEEPLTQVYCEDKEATPEGFITGSLPNQWDGDTMNEEALQQYATSPAPEWTLNIYQGPFPVWKFSLSGYPGSLKWTWRSMKPGQTYRPSRSTTSCAS